MRGNHSGSFSETALFLCAALLLALFYSSPAPAAVDGQRLFSAGRTFFDGQQLFSLVSADVNGDPYPDLVVSQYLKPADYSR